VDFKTAEEIKRCIGEADEPVRYPNILGLEERVTAADVVQAIQDPMDKLADAISKQILSVNSTAPSAVFLAGGGSKLLGLKQLVAQALEMDEKRVALAGNNYEMSAFSEEYELNDPEFATPLGIAVSAGLGLISDSYRIMLNDQPAKLFRSGTLTVLDLLMMNGYNSADLVGRTGKSLSVTVDGQRMTFRGQSATPCVLRLNGQEAAPSALVYAGDCIEFIPAVQGDSAARTVRELLGMDFPGGVLVNGKPVGMEYVLSSGDQIVTTEEPLETPEPEPEPLEPPELEEPEESG